jgi:hypothetical protein
VPLRLSERQRRRCWHRSAADRRALSRWPRSTSVIVWTFPADDRKRSADDRKRSADDRERSSVVQYGATPDPWRLLEACSSSRPPRPPLLHPAADSLESRRSLSPSGRRAGGEPMATIRPADRARARNRIRHEHPLDRRRVGADVLQPSHHVADLVDPRPEQLRAWRDAPLAECRARISTQAASTGRNRCSSAARGSAPTIRSTSLPSRITTSNGIDCAPNLEASPGFVSTSTFTTFRCPA